jgi:hypothetical protein
MRAIDRKTPFDAVLKWLDKKPELFTINPRQLTLGYNIFLTLLALGSHENFFRDFKRSIGITAL